MAQTDYNIDIIIQAQNKASTEFDKLKKQVEKLQETVDKMQWKMWNTKSVIDKLWNSMWTFWKVAMWVFWWNVLTKWVDALIGQVKNLKQAIDDWIESARMYEYYIERFSIMVKNSKAATDEEIDWLIALNDALDKTWVASKQWMIAMQSQFASFDMTIEQIQALTPAMLDYVIAEKWATAWADEYKQAATEMSKALQGNFWALRMNWRVIDEETEALMKSNDEMEKTQWLIQMIQSTYGWFNTEIAKTSEWIKMLKDKALNNLAETIWWTLIPLTDWRNMAVTDMANNITEKLSWVTAFFEENWTIIRDTVWDLLSAIFWTVTDIFGAIFGVISDVLWEITSAVFNTSEDSLSAMQKILIWVQRIVAAINTAKNSIVWVVKIAWNVVTWLVQIVLNAIKMQLNVAIEWINRVLDKVNSITWKDRHINTYEVQSFWDIFEWVADNVVTNAVEMWNAMDNTFQTMYENIEKIKRNEKSWHLWKMLGNTLWDDDGTSKSKSSTKQQNEELKKIQETYKRITKSVDEQYKKIWEVNKEWEKWYDELQDQFDEFDKNVKSLTKDVQNLRDELSQLWKDETKDIASEFVSARKELQKMERDYKGIWEVASQYSLDFLENYEHWGIWKYDIDALIQYKKYSDEMASVYEWMNAEERKAMDEQIAYQEWYESLNDIQKIKEDYRIKREEIQWELNEKLSALHKEEAKRAEIDRQMKQYSKERLAALDVEIKKRVAMYTEKMEYEKQYQQQLEIDYQKQMDMYNELIRKAKELAEVRAGTWWPDWRSTRASWWPVYAWQKYLVWENWPEMFVPSQNGTIVPNSKMWWEEINVNINLWGVAIYNQEDETELVDKIKQWLVRELELYKKWIY